MNINLRIELLIIDGLRGALDGALIQAAVEAELGRRLSQRGIPKDLQTGANRDRLLATTFRLDPSPDARGLGAQVGAGVYSAIAGGGEVVHSHG